MAAPFEVSQLLGDLYPDLWEFGSGKNGPAGNIRSRLWQVQAAFA